MTVTADAATDQAIEAIGRTGLVDYTAAAELLAAIPTDLLAAVVVERCTCITCGHPVGHHDAGHCWTDENGQETGNGTTCRCTCLTWIGRYQDGWDIGSVESGPRDERVTTPIWIDFTAADVYPRPSEPATPAERAALDWLAATRPETTT